MKKALLVLDMQNVCVGKNPAPIFKYNKEALILNVNKEIKSRKHDLVVYIRTVLSRHSILGFLSPIKAIEGSPEANLVDDLVIVSEHILSKVRGNAFTNPQLLKLLQEHQIEEVEIVGLDGGGCVSLTALGAIDNGFKVTINTQAVGTMFDKRQAKLFAKLKQKGAKFI